MGCLHAGLDAWFPEFLHVLLNLELAELDIVDDSVISGIDTAQYSIACEILDAAAVLKVLESLGE